MTQELKKRLLTGAIVGGLVVWVLFSGSFLMLWLLTLAVSAVGTFEFGQLLKKMAVPFSYWVLAIPVGFFHLIALFEPPVEALLLLFFGLGVFWLLVPFLRVAFLTNLPKKYYCWHLFWLVPPPVLFFLIWQRPQGSLLLFLLLLVVSASDIGGYFGGKRFGRRKLAPQISPGKTIEGSVCGLLASVFVGGVYLIIFPLYHIFLALLLLIFLCLFSQAGDLLESWWKRKAGVKDSGSWLAGHGGLLDRVDGFLLATVVFFFWLLVFPPAQL